jgi:hypothetical protein
MLIGIDYLKEILNNLDNHGIDNIYKNRELYNMLVSHFKDDIMNTFLSDNTSAFNNNVAKELFFEGDYTYSIGRLEDGRWFWTWFDYYTLDDIHQFNERPSTVKILDILDPNHPDGDDNMGGFMYDSKEDMLNGIKSDELYDLGEEFDDDDFVAFYKWAIEKSNELI